MTTDTSELGLEALICRDMTGGVCDPSGPAGVVADGAAAGGTGWLCGNPKDYDREFCVDLVQLTAFLEATQPEVAEALSLREDSSTRRKFLSRLQGEISKQGVIEVLRQGVKHQQYDVDLFCGTPSPGNEAAAVRYGLNRFTVTRQLLVKVLCMRLLKCRNWMPIM